LYIKKIGLRAFLYKRRVLGVNSINYKYK